MKGKLSVIAPLMVSLLTGCPEGKTNKNNADMSIAETSAETALSVNAEINKSLEKFGCKDIIRDEKFFTEFMQTNQEFSSIQEEINQISSDFKITSDQLLKNISDYREEMGKSLMKTDHIKHGKLADKHGEKLREIEQKKEEFDSRLKKIIEKYKELCK